MPEGPKSLAGKRIVLTRSREQAREWIAELEEKGAEVLVLPLVGFAPAADYAPLDDALKALPQFDWILFTSQNAVRFFARRMRGLGMEATSPGSKMPLAGAVGPATAQAAAVEGFTVSYVAKSFSGESLVRELRDSLAGKKVLLPRSDRADNRVPDALRQAGAHPVEVVAYRTTAAAMLDAAILDAIRRSEVDAIVFASPSAFQNLSPAISLAELEKLSARIPFAAIGPTTAKCMRKARIKVSIEAGDASDIGRESNGSAGIVDAIDAYFQRALLRTGN